VSSQVLFLAHWFFWIDWNAGSLISLRECLVPAIESSWLLWSSLPKAYMTLLRRISIGLGMPFILICPRLIWWNSNCFHWW
jgi:hypothetical protein